jgi:hypothetical protein
MVQRADDARWMRRYLDRHPDAAVRSRPERRPFAVRNDGEVTCPACREVGADSVESFLIHHSDADGRPLAAGNDVPVTVPGDNTERSAAGYGQEITRLVDAGYSLASAQLAVTPAGVAIR